MKIVLVITSNICFERGQNHKLVERLRSWFNEPILKSADAVLMVIAGNLINSKQSEYLPALSAIRGQVKNSVKILLVDGPNDYCEPDNRRRLSRTRSTARLVNNAVCLSGLPYYDMGNYRFIGIDGLVDQADSFGKQSVRAGENLSEDKTNVIISHAGPRVIHDMGLTTNQAINHKVSAWISGNSVFTHRFNKNMWVMDAGSTAKEPHAILLKLGNWSDET